MDTQSSDFKKRLAEKKRKYKLSASMEGRDDLGKAFKNMGLNINSENTTNNKSIDIAPDKEFAFSEKDIPNLNSAENPDKGRSTNNIQVVPGNNNNTLDEIKKEDLTVNHHKKFCFPILNNIVNEFNPKY